MHGIYLFIYSSIYLFIYLFNYLSIYFFIYLFVPLTNIWREIAMEIFREPLKSQTKISQIIINKTVFSIHLRE